jgi:solute carrier family 25 carnitine/acylcarnitine transporter 20/29
MLHGIFVKEGLTGLYRGVAAPLLAVTPAFAVSFWSYDLAGRAIRQAKNIEHDQDLSIGQVAVAGAWSGVPLAIIFGPTDRIKCLMQVDNSGKYRNFMDCLGKTYADGGLRSVFRGTGSCALRDVPGNAAYFGAYESMKRLSCQLEGRETASTFGTLMAGGCAGVANWIIGMYTI